MNILTTILKKKVTVVFSRGGRNREPFLQFCRRGKGGQHRVWNQGIRFANRGDTGQNVGSAPVPLKAKP